MKKIVILYREKEGFILDADIDKQKQLCRAYAEKNRLDIHSEYTADSTDMFSTKDPLYQIRELAEKGEIQTILVYSYYCIGRHEVETPLVMKWFLNNDIKIYSVLEGSFL